MSLGAHLVELRKRLFISALAIVIASVGGFIISLWVIAQLQIPISEAEHLTGRHVSLNFESLTSAFDVRIQIAFTVGLVVASPVWLYEIWAFIVPALKRAERRYVYGFLGTAIPLFLIGCCAGWIIMPHMVQLLTGFAPTQSTSFISAGDFVDFITRLVIAVGIGFVMPVFLVVLNFIGIMSAKTILKGWRVAVLLIFVFTAIVTPSADIVSMFVLALPIIALYFIAALVAHLHDRAAARRAEAFSAEIAI
jgi:sec-independent protein translocase protein TatC